MATPAPVVRTAVELLNEQAQQERGGPVGRG